MSDQSSTKGKRRQTLSEQGFKQTDVYKYRDERGKLLYEVLRWEHEDGRKTFQQRRKRSDGRWTYRLDNTRRVPYRLPELLKAEPNGTFYVVEGEKDVHTLEQRDKLATCNSEGALKHWTPEWQQYFDRFGKAIIIADRDEKGRKHAAKVYHCLSPLMDCRIYEGRSGKDVTDHLAAGRGLRGLVDVTDAVLALRAASTNGASPHKSAGGDVDLYVEWALNKLFLDPPEGAVHNGRAEVAYKLGEQLRDVDRSVAEQAMRRYWALCPQTNSEGALSSYPLDSALDTLGSALDNVPTDWTPGVFAKALNEDRWDELLVNLGDVKEESLQWLWKNRFLMGKVSILEGDPDVGKSTVTLDIAARVTRGALMPDNTIMETDKRGVLVVSVEDDLADTIVPRLRVAKANMKNVSSLKLEIDDKGNAVPLTFPDDMPRLRHAIHSIDAALVVIDPITGFLSEGIMSGIDASVRKAMTPMAQVAADTGCAILMVRHLNKAGDMKAKYRGGGSIAFTGAARSVFVVDRHPEESGACVMARVKMNLTRSGVPSMAYELASSQKEQHPRVAWTGEVTIDADTLLRGADGREDAPARDEAVEMLKDVLRDGPLPVNSVRKLLMENGVSGSTLKRAKQVLEVRAIRDYDHEKKVVRQWLWALPDHLGDYKGN